MFNTIVKKAFLSLSLIFMVFALSIAQPPDGDGGDEDPDEGIPIDGGISLLAAAGIAYGAKKVYDRNKPKANEEEN